MEFKSQKPLFYHIRNTRRHVCDICGYHVHEGLTYCFAHILPKGQYPELKLVENNIALVCSLECHHEVDRIKSGNAYIAKQSILSGNLPKETLYICLNINQK